MANFQRDGIGWQLGKLRRNFDEWLELVNRSAENQNTESALPEWLPYLLYFLAWVLLICFGAWLGLIVYRALRNYWLERQGIFLSQETALPTHQSLLELLQKAQKFYNQKNYREACRYLYLALLQFLHDREILPQKVSRTDGEYRYYLEEKSLQHREECLLVINLHERLTFAKINISEEDCRACQTALDRVLNQP